MQPEQLEQLSALERQLQRVQDIAAQRNASNFCRACEVYPLRRTLVPKKRRQGWIKPYFYTGTSLSPIYETYLSNREVQKATPWSEAEDTRLREVLKAADSAEDDICAYWESVALKFNEEERNKRTAWAQTKKLRKLVDEASTPSPNFASLRAQTALRVGGAADAAARIRQDQLALNIALMYRMQELIGRQASSANEYSEEEAEEIMSKLRQGFLELRTAEQCMLRWHNKLRSEIDAKAWTELDKIRLFNIARRREKRNWEQISLEVDNGKPPMECLRMYAKLDRTRQRSTSVEEKFRRLCAQRFLGVSLAASSK